MTKELRILAFFNNLGFSLHTGTGIIHVMANIVRWREGIPGQFSSQLSDHERHLRVAGHHRLYCSLQVSFVSSTQTLLPLCHFV